MTAIELCKFCTGGGIEFSEGNGADDAYLLIDFWRLDEFAKLCGASFFDDGGQETNLCNGYVPIRLMVFEDYYNIDYNSMVDFLKFTLKGEC